MVKSYSVLDFLTLSAYCGIDCGACPAYVATQKDDDALRAETARKLLEGLREGW